MHNHANWGSIKKKRVTAQLGSLGDNCTSQTLRERIGKNREEKEQLKWNGGKMKEALTKAPLKRGVIARGHSTLETKREGGKSSKKLWKTRGLRPENSQIQKGKKKGGLLRKK